MTSRGTRRRIGTSYSIQTTRGDSQGGNVACASQEGAATEGFTSSGGGSRSGGTGGFSCASAGRAVNASAASVTLDNIHCFMTFLPSETNVDLRGSAVRVATKRYPIKPDWQGRSAEFVGIVGRGCQTARNMTDDRTRVLVSAGFSRLKPALRTRRGTVTSCSRVGCALVSAVRVSELRPACC